MLEPWWLLNLESRNHLQELSQKEVFRKTIAICFPRFQLLFLFDAVIVENFPDYLRKIIVQGRSSKSTKVGDIMTEEV